MTELKRGWTSQQLDIISPDDISYWSTSDAAILIGDGITPAHVRNMIRLSGMKPAGKRRGISRRGGRYVRVYAAADIMKVYEAIVDAAAL